MIKRTPFFLLGAALVAVALVGCDSAVSTAKLVKVTISYEYLVDGGTRHLSSGVWVLVGADQANPLFTKASAVGNAPGLEALAETGNNTELAAYLVDNGMVSGEFKGTDTGKTGMTLAAPPCRLEVPEEA